MMIVWIRKNKTGRNKNLAQPDAATFQKHNEEMKSFSFSHPKLESTCSRDILTPEGDILATVHEVRMAVHSQN